MSSSLQQQQGLNTLRKLNSDNNNDSNKVVQIQHDLGEQRSFKRKNFTKQSHQRDSQESLKTNDQIDMGSSVENITASNNDGEEEGHSHGSKCKHKHGGKGSHGHSHGKKPINYCVIIYFLFTCLSCTYIQTQHLNPYRADHTATLLNMFSWFILTLCLWSYYQTYSIRNTVKKHNKLPNLTQYQIQGKLFDPNYDLTKRICEPCNFYKLPRVSHCSSCGECIYKLDHHCMWTQTCIGHCNQRPFLLFCFYMTIGVSQFWVSTYRAVGTMRQTTGCGLNEVSFFDVFEPGVYILWGITCFSASVIGAMILALSVSHLMMVLTNFTTLDNMKKMKICPMPFCEWRKEYGQEKYINTFDRGQIQNIKSLFGNNILTFWLPLGRKIENQFIVEPMNPHPTKLQLMTYTNLYFDQENLQRKFQQTMLKIKEIYKGKTITLDGELIHL